MGKAVIHAGGAGSGQAAKICNNMLLGATMVATCEAFVARRQARARPADLLRHLVQGVGPELVDDQLIARSPASAPKRPADRDYEGGFAAALMLKDLKLAMEAAQRSRRLHADGRRGRGTVPALRRSAAAATKDFSGIIKMIDDSWKPPEDGPSLRSKYAYYPARRRSRACSPVAAESATPGADAARNARSCRSPTAMRCSPCTTPDAGR